MKTHAVIAVSMMLGGCGYIRDHPPTMGADPAQTGQEGLAMENELRRSFVIVPDIPTCSLTRPQYQERESREYRRVAKKGIDGRPDIDGIPDYVGCIAYRQGNEQDVAAHLEAGFAYSDYLCAVFFERITEHSSQRRFSRGLVNDVGAAVSAVLGLSNAPAAVVGGAGAGFGLADSSFRNYDDSFLVSADLATLQTKIDTEQKAIRKDALDEKPTSFPRANSWILKYANLCTYTGMKGLINTSLVETSNQETPSENAVKEYIAKFMAAARTAKDSASSKPADAVSDGNDGDAVGNSIADDGDSDVVEGSVESDHSDPM